MNRNRNLYCLFVGQDKSPLASRYRFTVHLTSDNDSANGTIHVRCTQVTIGTVATDLRSRVGWTQTPYLRPRSHYSYDKGRAGPFLTLTLTRCERERFRENWTTRIFMGVRSAKFMHADYIF